MLSKLKVVDEYESRNFFEKVNSRRFSKIFILSRESIEICISRRLLIKFTKLVLHRHQNPYFSFPSSLFPPFISSVTIYHLSWTSKLHQPVLYGGNCVAWVLLTEPIYSGYWLLLITLLLRREFWWQYFWLSSFRWVHIFRRFKVKYFCVLIYKLEKILAWDSSRDENLRSEYFPQELAGLGHQFSFFINNFSGLNTKIQTLKKLFKHHILVFQV